MRFLSLHPGLRLLRQTMSFVPYLETLGDGSPPEQP
jgi:hypothetical protein